MLLAMPKLVPQFLADDLLLLDPVLRPEVLHSGRPSDIHAEQALEK
jgi:hypothetical protein